MKRQDIRNIAIIAHVDHGKTTLVDAMLKQTHVQRNVEELGVLIMDSMDLERERGITIKAKNASVTYNGTKINIVDTPGHADFGGEVERTLRMVEGVLLLVDAKEGPMPQTKFVLKKALELGHKAIVVINKIDRSDAQIDEVVNKTFDLFVSLKATDEQLDFPIIYASGIAGQASLDSHKPGTDLNPLFDTILEKIPGPEVLENEPLQILVLALAYDSYKGKQGIGKITSGVIKKNMPIMQIAPDGARLSGRAVDISVFSGLDKKSVEEATAGEIVSVAGLTEVTIGSTITGHANPKQIDPVTVDEPTVQMTFAVNNSPFAGKEGKFVTSRNLRDRLYKELETNVALKVTDTPSPDTLLVAGRGELHLAILIETMRREGYELQVSQPEVIFKTIDGVQSEPFERLSVIVPNEFQGAAIEEVGRRKAELVTMVHTDNGEVHLDYVMSTRNLIGLKSKLMTQTKGTAIINHIFDSYKPAEAQIQSASAHGALIASESGVSNAYGLNNAQERGDLFIKPAVEVYQGMIVGENSKTEDIEINVNRTKKLTNMRASGSDDSIILTPPKVMSLEESLEFLASDELLEVTPQSLRLRKKILDPTKRKREKVAQEKNPA
ncbi:MAG: GTP-binding protein TypA [Candidatus Doudnabacteria bacterium RIFCSPLOWO2_02_FULL_42_9]|uniref:Large ribosomal subunit assembly factor BipA n=1 Tax=Candidatus Doudnabacteria bacterium RIFCSPHIGHO2_01_FULL_41_86 TaxID=1817821 RepID=A0A1F5N7K8_9BACT|nr:MAG: GTP-binding protein TypA [Candidatus Doudnabacteria bacterium RIFCSPHIGHO2_01_FULL_41_86]OGE75687.1 MAG: GTP-binding protein TypA [Candidatus Doudnabacteria bacterium RIFCSPHIGHO2_01_43_10]OGE85665.1 MAG: GTP-binding protein TypA [Candidatus Doudnabacteria bacterium RIFCSPHIGHO2_12_FULL_42_22]OGE87161.1 MAG: GTP-binding protein TypA [Candidatus Doudnabacteria bacterium RIFCSPHIGHO2_02_FULL_42_25]OGE91999.1 MAG: GTP-binding protein TypA [Candidatus Doudnabacteria bacterium RIFCSPLOWO2_01